MKLFFLIWSLYSQPVTWKFSAVKINPEKYEIHMTAAIEKGWHIYAGAQENDFVVPTTTNILLTSLVKTCGKAKEAGKLVIKQDELIGAKLRYYENSMDIIQVVSLEKHIKTTITGSVHFMACNGEECTPPADISFSITLP